MPLVGVRIWGISALTCLLAVGVPAVEAHAAPAETVGRVAADLPVQGDRSKAVVRLQQLLIAAGIRIAGGADGIFGPATAKAVRSFQSAKGLPATGVVDQATAVALGLRAATPRVARGSTGTEVREVQQRLQARGVTVPGGADGRFGPATEQAVRTFQKANRIPVTGAVDAYTAALLARKGASTSTRPTSGRLAIGSRGQAVVSLQRQLIAVGSRPTGGADGVYGTATAKAVARFQRWMGLSPTGAVDAATRRALDKVAGRAGAGNAAGVRLAAFPLPRTCAFGDSWGDWRGGGRRHVGTDISARVRTPVYAVADGRVTAQLADFPGSRGGTQMWLTDAAGNTYFYAHLTWFADGIRRGTRVRAGQLIAYSGNTGISSGPHLHFEVHPSGGSPVNPYPILRRTAGCG